METETEQNNNTDEKFLSTIYTQAMEDFRHRVRVEWQTFAVVNVIYAAGIKALIDSDDNCFSLFGASVLTIAVLLFSAIWCIRIYGNAYRTEFCKCIFTTGHFFGVPKTCVEIVEPVSSAESDDWRGMTGIS